jgi:hypothetical protein
VSAGIATGGAASPPPPVATATEGLATEGLGDVLGDVTSESTLVKTLERFANVEIAKKVSNDTD